MTTRFAPRVGWVTCALAVTFAFALVAPAVGGATSTVTMVVPQVKLVVPMYTSPTALWPAIHEAGAAVGMVILNPAISDRFTYNSTLASLVATQEADGIQVLGYIPTDFDNGVVPLNYSEAMVNNYATWYHVDGYFVDEVNGTCASGPLSYYTALSSFARSEPGSDIVVMNPGDDVAPCNPQLANIFVTFEGTYQNYLAAKLPAWGASLPRGDFMNIIYDAPNATAMVNAIQLAASRNVGMVYVTDNDGPNPYSTLPTYLQQEATYVESLATTTTLIQSASSADGSASSTTSTQVRTSTTLSGALSSPEPTESPTVASTSSTTTLGQNVSTASSSPARTQASSGFATLAVAMVGIFAAFGAGMWVTAILARGRDRPKRRSLS